jgi:hypothetical protein
VIVVLCTALLAAACSQPDASAPIEPAASGSTVPVPDARLGPVVEALEAHPDWTGGASQFEVASALPSLRALCVAVTSGDGDDLHVMVDVEANPWEVQAVAIFDDVDGPRVTHEAEAIEGNGDLCSFVLLGTPDPFPPDPTAIEVSGAVDGAQVEAIRQAVHATPERFGVNRDGAPSINLQPAAGAPDGIECFEGIVYVGGPRAKVLIGLTQGSAGWAVHSVRVVEQALRPAVGPPPGGC